MHVCVRVCVHVTRERVRACASVRVSVCVRARERVRACARVRVSVR